jgi:hypothetical protein
MSNTWLSGVTAEGAFEPLAAETRLKHIVRQLPQLVLLPRLG